MMYRESALLLIGDELLDGRTRDVNLVRFSGILGEMGLPVQEARFAADDTERIACAVRELRGKGRVLITTGGLGPTGDDLTSEAVATAFGLPVRRSGEAETIIREKYRSFGSPMPSTALTQAELPEGAVPVVNPAGIAPGIVLEVNGAAVICLPGVPRESESLLLPCLKLLGPISPCTKRTFFIRTWGLKENALHDRLMPLAAKYGLVPAYLPSPGRVDIRIKGTGAEEFSGEVRELLAGRIYSTLRDETLEEVLGRTLIEKGLTLATAESCTGGGVGFAVTSVPGASSWYAGGIVSYSNELKEGLLGVPAELLTSHGAVSGETAEAMARGVLKSTGADCALAVTGIAGPSGGTPLKPVGTLWTSALCPVGSSTVLWQLGGDRETIREGAVSRALGSLLELLS